MLGSSVRAARRLSSSNSFFSCYARHRRHCRTFFGDCAYGTPFSLKASNKTLLPLSPSKSYSVLPSTNVSADITYSAIELALDSVVKIFTVSSSPNYFLPWQNKSQRETFGSGFIIAGKRILTNAHVVADHTFVLVRKHGSPIKYRAEVQAVGHECDLAILIVRSEEFWEGMIFLELGDIPFLQEAVAVVGYPQGNNSNIPDCSTKENML
ncbi:hypothetical protein U1Q18_047555 [Sarracenia purpurea var. burkii]